MGTGKAVRVWRVVYQWKFKGEQQDNNAMIECAEKIADGRAPLKKARLLKITDITTELDEVTIDRAPPARRPEKATSPTCPPRRWTAPRSSPPTTTFGKWSAGATACATITKRSASADIAQRATLSSCWGVSLVTEQVGEVLRRVVTSHGSAVLDDQRRLRAILKDLAGNNPGEISLVLAAVDAQVPHKLLDSGSTPAPVIQARLVEDLEKTVFLTGLAARWAVQTWAFALSLASACPPPLPSERTVTTENAPYLADSAASFGLAPYSSGPGPIPMPDRPAADYPATHAAWPAKAAIGREYVPRVDAAADTAGPVSGGAVASGNSRVSATDTVTARSPSPGGLTHLSGRRRRHRVAAIMITAAGILATVAAVATLASSPPPTISPKYSLIRTLTDPAASTTNYGGDGAYAMAFSPGGKTLAIADNSGRIYLWDPATGALDATLTDPDTGAGSGAVAFSPDGSRLARAGHALYLWDFATRKLVASMPKPDNGCCTTLPVAFSPDGAILAFGSDGGRTYLLNGYTGKILAVLTNTITGGGPNGVFALAFSPDGRTLAVGGINSGTCLWSVATRRQTACIPDPSSEGVNAVAFSPNGKTLATGDGNGRTYLWNASTLRLSATLDAPGSGARYVESLAFSPDGRTIAVADYNGHAYLWDVSTGKLAATLTEPAGYPSALAFSPDGSKLATLTPYGRTYLWEAA